LAQQAQPANSRPGIDPKTSAWITLLSFFALFCVLVAGSAFLGWRYYTTSVVTIDGILLRSHVNAGVTIQARGQRAPSSIERLTAERDPCVGSPDICVPLSEGDSVRTAREAGYGPVASIVLPDETHIQLWASPTGAELELNRYQVTRWNQARQDVLLSQKTGYARYDIASDQPYDQVDYIVEIDAATRVELLPGGSYSIYVPDPASGRALPVTHDGRPVLVEVATRAGQATLVRGTNRAVIAPGEKVQVGVAGTIEDPIPAQWELVLDGGFTEYHQQNEYGPDSKTWVRLWSENAPGLTAAEKNFQFSVVQACRPETPDLCAPEDQVFIGQFRRDGNQTKPFTIGIKQPLDVDVSEYTSLRLRGWVRVLQQSIPGTGSQGSECPIMLTLIYKPTSPTDQEQPRRLCVFISDDANTNMSDLEVIRYRPVPAYTWYHLDIELRNDSLIRQARYIQTVYIEARGHDYLAEVTGLSLVGSQ
jgi:hypothetical protein